MLPTLRPLRRSTNVTYFTQAARSPARHCALALAMTLSLTWAWTAPAHAAEPRLDVSTHTLARALHCQPQVRNSRREPLMLVTGTGFSGSETWGSGTDTALLVHSGHPSCFVDFPDYTTADIQTSVQYLVYGIRSEARRAHRQIAILGISQGALLPRLALTYWPSLRRLVSDVVAVAGPQHGTTWAAAGQLIGNFCTSKGCPPAFWQQWVGSHLLDALNAHPDETPGPTAWTTVRSLTDDVVQPEYGPYPTSSLHGAGNILVQAVCPGRKTGSPLRLGVTHRWGRSIWMPAQQR